MEFHGLRGKNRDFIIYQHYTTLLLVDRDMHVHIEKKKQIADFSLIFIGMKRVWIKLITAEFSFNKVNL